MSEQLDITDIQRMFRELSERDFQRNAGMTRDEFRAYIRVMRRINQEMPQPEWGICPICASVMRLDTRSMVWKCGVLHCRETVRHNQMVWLPV